MIHEEKYFAAANSGKGFIGYYDAVFAEARRKYIIKGGPGTGKSRFMREISQAALESGRDVIYYYCSSDPSSLDGLLIDGRLAFLDGTAPHTAEASCPGARDELIDLGAFWDSLALTEKREEIEYHAGQKAKCFSRAYEFLSAARNCVIAADTVILPAVEPFREMIQSAARRILRPIRNSGSYYEKRVLTDSYGMRGKVSFDTLAKSATSKISVSDFGGASYVFFDAVVNEAKRREISVVISCSPLMPERPDAVFLPDSGTYFFAGEDGDRHINVRRFIDASAVSPYSGELRGAMKLKLSAENAALNSFSAAAKHHFALEDIYIAAMDFTAKEEFTRRFLSRIF